MPTKRLLKHLTTPPHRNKGPSKNMDVSPRWEERVANAARALDILIASSDATENRAIDPAGSDVTTWGPEHNCSLSLN